MFDAYQELRPLIITIDMPKRAEIVNMIKPVFTNLENRIIGNCRANYSVKTFYDVCRCARAFDPFYARSSS